MGVAGPHRFGPRGIIARGETRTARRFLPARLQIIGYARSELTVAQLHERLRPFLKGDAKAVQSFLDVITYTPGEYTGSAGYSALQQRLVDWEAGGGAPSASK